MELSGTVYKILPIQSGTGANGTWTKQEIVIETEGQYPKKVCVSCFGKVLDNLDTLHVGVKIKAHINIESREYNDRWYSEIKAWRIEHESGAPTKNNNEVKTSDSPEDDLPF